MSDSCVVCRQRRGRRNCVVLAAGICSQCCGRGRRRTIDCPDRCAFFSAGARQAATKLAVAGGNPDFDDEMADVLHNLRRAIAQVRAGRAHDMTDEEARQALSNAADTLRTRSKGLVYDFRSPDPRVQWIVNELMTVAGWHERGEKGLRRLSPAELSSTLRHLETQARRLMGERSSGTAFLDLVAQSVGRRYVGAGGEWVG